jgi:uncharacterized protein YjbI with pentapeptide repeats
MLDFNFSEFITNNKLILDGKKLSNYRISGIRKESVEIKRCIMENMVFENDFEGDVVFIEECTFINCKFFDVFKREELLLLIMNNTFRNCIFENVSYHGYIQQSEVVDSEFLNCVFKNIEIKGDVSFINLNIQKSSVTSIYYEGNQILGNEFVDVSINDSIFKGAAIQNRIEKVYFRSVKLIGYNQDNEFIDSNTDGFIFIEEF